MLLRSLNLIPPSCDFHLLKSFIIVFFCPEASAAMLYCNHTGYAACRVCVYYALYFYIGMHETETSADTCNNFNNGFCLAVSLVTSLVYF